MARTPIVIVGSGTMAQVVAEYLDDSPYEVVAFAATREYVTSPECFGRPLVDFDGIENGPYRPSVMKMFVAIGYDKLNRTRARFYRDARRRGYELVTYVHPTVPLWRSNEIGDNVFVFEHNVIQPFVRIGADTTLWSGNHIGHHSRIGEHCFISSHVVVSGQCEVGDYTFIGVNSTLRDGISVGRGCFLGAGTLVLKSTGDGVLFATAATEPHKVPAARFFKLPVEDSAEAEAGKGGA
jgi:sugar O-acyltransferase (sialic acid O-acetyltransferase NeuD family)